MIIIVYSGIFSIQYTYTVSVGTSYGTLLMVSYTLIMLLLFYPGVAQASVCQIPETGQCLFVPQSCSVAGNSFVKHAYCIFSETRWPPSFSPSLLLSSFYLSARVYLKTAVSSPLSPIPPPTTTTRFQAVKWTSLSKPNWFKGKQK